MRDDVSGGFRSGGDKEQREASGWFTRGVGGIGAASLLSDLGYEVTTSLLPSLLTSTSGAPAAALGLIEGIADVAAGLARFAGGTLADGISSLGLHPALYASKRSPAWWRRNASAIWLLAEFCVHKNSTFCFLIALLLR